MMGSEALEFCINNIKFNSVLDIGCGSGEHLKVFESNNKNALGIDLLGGENILQGNYLNTEVSSVDLIWASHVLEHQLNVNFFLTKCYNDLNEEGHICITVPPLKHQIVGGHVTIWNAGLVLYNLILAGFDCRQAKIKQYGYNISVIAQKGNFKIPELNYDNGDIEKLSQWFPIGYNYQNFNGNILEYNWN